jgi:hypothetical protein
MRFLPLLIASLAIALSITSTSAQICNQPAACPTNPAQVPTPFFSLTFDSPVSSAVSYTYLPSSGDGCNHTGLVVLGASGGISDGTGQDYIDLNSNSTAQSAGATIPSLGMTTDGGNLTNGTRGWTFETTFKAFSKTTWAKMFCIGNGAGPADILMGFNGAFNNGNFEIDFTMDTATGLSGPRTNSGAGNIVVTPVINLGSWYHMVVVVQQVDAAGQYANWFAYVNGVQSGATGTTQFTVPDAARPGAYLGRSCYNPDALFNGTIDAFRIYNSALTADQVSSLYAQQMGNCTIPVVANPIITSLFPFIPFANISTPPTPIWSLNFSSNPIPTAVGANGTASYTWESVDLGDVPCNVSTYHQGLILLAGGPDVTENWSDPSWVNLSATTGPNSVGNAVLPILGGPTFSNGSISAGNAGLTFEVVFKPALMETWAKLFDFGSNRATYLNITCANDLVLGWVSNSLQYMNFEVCDASGNGISTGSFGPFLAGQWYHVVITLQQVNGSLANWYIYSNNVLVSVTSNGPFPQGLARPWSTLGKSNWNDESWSGWIDTLNIYNQAVSPAQVQTMFTNAMGPSGAVSCAFNVSTSPDIPSSALYYELTFASNPAQTTPAAYQWIAFDPSDTLGNQAVHTGIVNISGCIPGNCAGSYINMSASTGNHSVGKVLGDVGGLGTGSINDNSVGWSFEYTFKPFFNTTWAKLMDLGDGNGGGVGDWEIFMGWYNNANYFDMGVIWQTTQDYSDTAHAQMDDLNPATPVLSFNTWYHMVMVLSYSYLQSETSEGTITYDGGIDYASYLVYLNGVLVANSSSNLYPPKVTRIHSCLGKSNYGDPFWQGLIDTFRVYSIALNPNQVTTLYQSSLQPPTSASSSSGVPSGNLTSSSSVPSGNVTSSSSGLFSNATSSSSGLFSNATSSSSAPAANVTSSSSGPSGINVTLSSSSSSAPVISGNASSSSSFAVAVNVSSSSARGSSSSPAVSAVSSSSAVSAVTSALSQISSAPSAVSAVSSATSAIVQSSSVTSALPATSAPSSAAVQASSSSSSPAATSAVSPPSSSSAPIGSVTSSSPVSPFVTSVTSLASSSSAIPSSTSTLPPTTVSGADAQAGVVLALMLTIMGVIAMVL